MAGPPRGKQQFTQAMTKS